MIHCRGTPFGSGEIRGRNAFLLHLALMESPFTTGTIAIGIHAGSDYCDCSSEFIALMQQSFDFHACGTISVCAPFITYNKVAIFALALDLELPIDRTYSCEAGTMPCGACLSCLDRLELVPKRDHART